MTVLVRLVARAMGTATAALRPRTPSRFEVGQGIGVPNAASGSNPIATDQAPVMRDPPNAPNAPSATDPVQSKPSQTHASPPPPLVTPAEPRDRKTATSKASNASSGQKDVNSTRVPKPEDARDFEPTNSRPEPRAEMVYRLNEPRSAAPPEAQGQPRSQIQSMPLAEPPPLLPLARTEAARQVTQHIAAAIPPTPRPPTKNEPTAPEPDVTIHIGRLDLTGTAPKPAARPRRKTQSSSAISLDDYLKGGQA